MQAMADPKEEQLSKLRMVLAVAEKNGNQLFIDNIKRDIEALERGEESPIIAEYLTDEERDWTDVDQSPEEQPNLKNLGFRAKHKH